MLFDLPTFTLVHVVLSLVGIVAGLVVLVILPLGIAALYWKHLAGGWRQVFVVTTVLARAAGRRE